MKEIEIPEGYEARIEGNKVIIELKESEDERIKRGLLRCLDDINDGWIALHGISKNDAIAYLEKQKDLKYSEEQMEDIRQYAYNNGIVDAEERHKEQNTTEWSEEDEQMLSSIETELLTLIDSYEFLFNQPDTTKAEQERRDKAVAFKHKQVDWLNDLPNRIHSNHWKPSEEQIDALEKIWIECSNNPDSVILGELLEQLKQL